MNVDRQGHLGRVFKTFWGKSLLSFVSLGRRQPGHRTLFERKKPQWQHGALTPTIHGCRLSLGSWQLNVTTPRDGVTKFHQQRAMFFHAYPVGDSVILVF